VSRNTCPLKCPVRGDKRDTHRSGSDREDPARPKLLLAGVAPDEHPEQRVFRCPVPNTRRSGMPGPPASAVPSEQTRQLEGSATHSCFARATCNWASGTRALLRVERGHSASRLTRAGQRTNQADDEVRTRDLRLGKTGKPPLSAHLRHVRCSQMPSDQLAIAELGTCVEHGDGLGKRVPRVARAMSA